MEYLNTEQVQNALTKASENLKHYTVVATLLFSGMRASECANLMVRNIDFDNKKIGIVGKGSKYRDIFVSPELLTILRVWITYKNLKSYDRMWKYHRNSITNICKRYTGLSAHKMRHTYAINVLTVTHDLNYLRQNLGHSSLGSTQVYLRFADYTEQNKALSKLYKEELK